MDALEAARRWVHCTQAAWRNHDVDAIARLYTDDCVYHSHPFRPAHQGRDGVIDYTTRTFAVEYGNDVWFGEPIAHGDHAAIEYWVTMVEEGEPVTLAGCCVMRFTSNGQVDVTRDYWHVDDGTRARPIDWAW